MPQAHLPAADTGLPITREQVEAKIALLIDLLDTLDGDPDLEPDSDIEDGADDEPSLGWTAGFRPEFERQEGRGFYMNADGGRELEDEHCGREPGEDAEPDVDAEHSLGWGTGDSQTGQWTIVTDLEQGAGAVRKPRPASKTGGKVLRGCEVLV
jgi:hypothetical protein